MEFIEGSRVGSNMVIYKNFCYYVSKKCHNKVYVTCRKKKCHGSGIIHISIETYKENFEINTEHSHSTDAEFITGLRFKTELKRECHASPDLSTRQVFNKVFKRFQDCGVTYSSVKSVIVRSRKRDERPPKTNQEMLKELLPTPSELPPKKLKMKSRKTLKELRQEQVKEQKKFNSDRKFADLKQKSQTYYQILPEVYFEEGSRVGSKMMVFQDYCYIVNKKHISKTKLYLTCRIKSCHGCGIVFCLEDADSGYFSPGKEHSHPPDVEFIKTLRFRSELRHESKTARNSSLRNIFNKISQRYEGANNDIKFSSVESLMSRSRRRTELPCVSNLQELGNVLTSLAWSSLGKSCQDSKPWFCGVHTATDETNIAAFINDEISKTIGTVQPLNLQFDGTFKYLPLEFKGCQMLTAFVSIQEKVFAFAFFLMETKSLPAYQKCLEVLEECTGAIDPALIYTDFEPDLHTTLKIAWPSSPLLGCYIHFVQDVVDKCRKEINIFDIEFKMYIVRLLLALPFLPAELIQTGFNNIQYIIAENGLNEDFQHFIESFHEVWLAKTDPDVLSVFNQTFEMSNYVEYFHRKLKNSLITRNKVWPFIDGLRAISYNEQVDFIQYFSGVPHVKRKMNIHIKQDRLFINAMTAMNKSLENYSITESTNREFFLTTSIFSFLDEISDGIKDLIQRIVEEPKLTDISLPKSLHEWEQSPILLKDEYMSSDGDDDQYYEEMDPENMITIEGNEIEIVTSDCSIKSTLED